jgi:hypothetical protein
VSIKHCDVFSNVGNAYVGHPDDGSMFGNRHRRTWLERGHEKLEFVELIEKRRNLKKGIEKMFSISGSTFVVAFPQILENC